MEITFLQDNMGTFWDDVKVLLTAISPGIMVVFSVVAASLLLGIIVKAWRDSTKEPEEDEDYEVKHY